MTEQQDLETAKKTIRDLWARIAVLEEMLHKQETTPLCEHGCRHTTITHVNTLEKVMKKMWPDLRVKGPLGELTYPPIAYAYYQAMREDDVALKKIEFLPRPSGQQDRE